jgi:hypothetical protein
MDDKIPKQLRAYIKKARATKKKENKISQKQVAKQNQIVIINQESKPKRQTRTRVSPRTTKRGSPNDYPRMVYAPSFSQPQPPAPIAQQPQPAQPAPQVPPQFQPIQIPRAPFMNEPLRSSLNPPSFSNLEPEPRNMEQNLPFIPIPRPNPFTPSVGSVSFESDPFRSISPLTMNSEMGSAPYDGRSETFSSVTEPSYFTRGSEMGSTWGSTPTRGFKRAEPLSPYDGRSEVRSQRTATTFGDLLSSPPFSDLEPPTINQEQNLPFIPVPRQNPILQEIVQEPNRRDFLSQPSSGSLSSRSINPSSLPSQGFVSNESVNQLNQDVDEELSSIMNFGREQNPERNYSAMPTVLYDTADDTTIRSFGSGNAQQLDMRSIGSITGGGGFVENKAINDLAFNESDRLRQLLLKEEGYGKNKKREFPEDADIESMSSGQTPSPRPKRGRPQKQLSQEDIDILESYVRVTKTIKKKDRTPEENEIIARGLERYKALRDNKERNAFVDRLREQYNKEKAEKSQIDRDQVRMEKARKKENKKI